MDNPTAAPAANPTLAGQAILVTGGASGLGAALCTELAMAGATVMIGDMNRERAAELADSLRRLDCRAHPLALDVRDVQSVESGVAETLACCGRLDILVNNAGVDVTLPVAELSYEAWCRVIDTNLNGPFLLSKHAAEHMKRQGGGQIVNIASTAAKRAWPNASAYHASKWGLLGLSHALHAELRPHGIKVTAVVAGGMRTPFLLDRFPDIDIASLQEPANVARAVKAVLLLPAETVVPEIMVLPMRETSWP